MSVCPALLSFAGAQCVLHQLAVVTVHAYVDDDGAVLYHIGGDEFCLSDGDHKYVCAACVGSQIGGAGMADINGTVCAQKQKRHGLSDDIAAADDHAVLSGR